MREPFHSVGDSFSLGGPNQCSVTAVVLHGWANVPGIQAMWGPRASVGGFLMDNKACAWRSHWCGIEVKGSIKLGIA